MRRRRMIFGLIMAFALSVLMFHDGAYASNEAKKVDVQFLHDIHSHLNTFATVENGESQMMGGFARIKTLINAYIKA
jgi:2',3'-cyclic-nucleotide 2'-phosphodiesterase (5'-nucleotidase family)